MHPHLAASLDVLEEQCDALLALLRQVDDGCLNWTPPVPDANSIAALIRHTVGSLDSWFARALDEPVARDRAAEFGYRGTAADLAALVEGARERTRAHLARLDAVAPATVRRVRRQSINQDQEVSVAWCVAHAASHAGEHWGQIQLTRDWYARRDA